MGLPPAVMWVDPGKATGIALWSIYIRNKFQVWELDFMGASRCIESICASYRHELWVGWEHFTIGPRTPAADAHSAIEMIGVTRLHAMSYACTILPRAMPDERTVATAKMLIELGWWLPGKDDAQSAAQHLLAWMLRTGKVPPDVSSKLAALRSQGRR